MGSFVKALVIAPQPFFSPRGTPLSVYYRILVMAELGVEVDLLVYGQGQDVEIPKVRIIRIPRFARSGEVKIGPSLQKLFLDIFMMLYTFYLLFRNKYDFVHAHEEAVFFCLFFKVIFRLHLVYDMHSSLPQQLTNFQFTKSKLLINLFFKLELFSIRTADIIITICPDLYNYVNSIIKDISRNFLIENSIFDPVRVGPATSDCNPFPIASQHQQKPIELPPEKKYVVYTGTLEPYQGIDILISAFAKLINDNEDTFLLIVGGTRRQVEYYSRLVNKYGLGSNCLLTGRVAQPLAKHYSKLASVLVSSRVTGTNTPLKIYEQLASSIPLVATNVYSHTQVLNDNVAYLVEPTPDAMASGIKKALNSGKEGHRIAANAKKLYEEKYSRAVYVQKMQQILDLLI